MQETQVQSLGWEDPLEKGVATHSSTLAQATHWTEETGGLQFMGSQESDTNEQLNKNNIPRSQRSPISFSRTMTTTQTKLRKPQENEILLILN